MTTRRDVAWDWLGGVGSKGSLSELGNTWSWRGC